VLQSYAPGEALISVSTRPQRRYPLESAPPLHNLPKKAETASQRKFSAGTPRSVTGDDETGSQGMELFTVPVILPLLGLWIFSKALLTPPE